MELPFSRLVRIAIVLLSLAVLPSCLRWIPPKDSATPKDAAYRTLSSEVSPCDQVVFLKNGQEIAKSSEQNALIRPNRADCYLSTYNIVENSSAARQLGVKSSYTLSFVELPENNKKLLLERQLDDLTAHLNQSETQVVVVFVHGWRHDAAPGNDNVRKFRAMLRQIRTGLNLRCQENLAVGSNKYCDAELTGVYVAWRGRSYAEPTARKNQGGFNLPALRTVNDRKSQSERLAMASDWELSFKNEDVSPIGYVLRKIEKATQGDNARKMKNRMLVMGHSFGGNMLATWLAPQMRKAIAEHKPGSTFEPIVGDMTVLVNPAAEAWKWTMLQREMRRRAGIPDNIHAIRPVAGKHSQDVQDALARWATLFPPEQVPNYLSFTSTRNWYRYGDNDSTHPGQHDIATRWAFPFRGSIDSLSPSNVLMPTDMPFSHEELNTAIGHLRPRYASGRSKRVRGPYGATHEFSNTEVSVGDDE